MTYNPTRALELLRIGSGRADAVFREGQEDAIRHIVEGKGTEAQFASTGLTSMSRRTHSPTRSGCLGSSRMAMAARTVTGGGSSSAKLPQFKAVNTVLSNLKTSFSGTYHAFAFANYAHRYLAEIQYRFNRRFDLKIILHRLLGAAVATPPQPARILRSGLTEVRR